MRITNEGSKDAAMWCEGGVEKNMKRGRTCLYMLMYLYIYIYMYVLMHTVLILNRGMLSALHLFGLSLYFHVSRTLINGVPPASNVTVRVPLPIL